MSYPIFKEFDCLLTEEEINEFYKLIDAKNIQFSEAEIYDRTNNENKRDDATRKCKECILSGDVLKWLDSIITKKINTEKNYRYVMMTSKARIISYNENNFFAKHVDVTNIYSSEFKDYSLLINLEPCEEGGETALYINDDFSYKSSITGQKRGAGLLFSKTLVHEGLPIKKGNKLILFVTYACFLEEQDYLIIEVESESFVIPVTMILNNDELVYHSFYNFNKRKNPDQHVFIYKEDMIDLNAFKIFYADIMKNEGVFENEGVFDLLENKEDYKNLIENMDYIGHKISDLKNYEQTEKNFELEIYGKKSWNIIKESIKNNKIFAFFECKIISFQDLVVIEQLKVNNKLIFCSPNVTIQVTDGDDQNIQGWAYRSEFDCNCFFNPTVCDKRVLYYKGPDEDVDSARSCFDCMSKMFRIFKLLKTEELISDKGSEERSEERSECDLLTKFIKTCRESQSEESKSEESKKYVYDLFDDACLKRIFDFFNIFQDERFLNTTIEGTDEGGKDIHPDEALDYKKTKRQIPQEFLNNIKFGEILYEVSEMGEMGEIELDPFKILSDIMDKDEISVFSEDKISGYSGKSNWDYIHEEGIIYGILNRSNYALSTFC